ncbi:Rieske 2Fe-2S domain-containing protein [Ramlibacter sp. WS9]|uniref:Rieske 2Fe-2S domain-containing protein n=1 Tax=Ramlibacter sp. WS9 TaxID=1882741 RepID=UPI0021021AD8|nr:Rieske 2Fe-2S domain-containing protein [Ramlibacter sp. WS9]
MSSTTKQAFVEVCAVEDLWMGEMESFEVASHEVLILNVDGELQAFDGICPHQSVSLVEGRFDGKVLTCRAHEWSFDACTGEGINPKAECLRRFALRIEGGKVFVSTDPSEEQGETA